MPSSDKRDRKNEAKIAGGTALALGTPAVARIEQKQQKLRLKRVEAQIAGHTAAKPVKPDPATRLHGGKYHPEGPKQKFGRQQATKEWAGKLSELNAKKNKIATPKIYPKQTKLWAAGLATGVPLAWHGARNHKKVEKKWTQRDADAAAIGAVGGFAGYQGGSLALKPLEKPAERKIKSDAKLKAALEEHRAATLPKNAKAGDPAWRKYNRTYPKHLPGARLKRANAVAVSGKSGGALTLGAIGAGAAGAVALDRKKRVKKNMSTSAFGIDHGDVFEKKRDRKKGALTGAAVGGATAGAAGGAYGGAVSHSMSNSWPGHQKYKALTTAGKLKRNAPMAALVGGAGLGAGAVGGGVLGGAVGRKKKS